MNIIKTYILLIHINNIKGIVVCKDYWHLINSLSDMKKNRTIQVI